MASGVSTVRVSAADSGCRRASMLVKKKSLFTGFGLPARLDVGEEEKLVLPDRPAEVAAELVELHLVAGQAGDVVVIVVGIQRRVAHLFEHAAVELVGAALGNELDLGGPLAGGFGSGGGGGQGNFFNRVLRDGDVHEEAVAALQELVLCIQPVESDVERAVGQPVDAGIAVRAGGLYQLGAARHLHGFGHRTQFELDVGCSGHTCVYLDVLNRLRPEALHGHADLENSVGHRWQNPIAAIVGGGFESLAVVDIGHDDLGAGHRRALRVNNCAIQRTGGGNLAEQAGRELGQGNNDQTLRKPHMGSFRSNGPLEHYRPGTSSNLKPAGDVS